MTRIIKPSIIENVNQETAREIFSKTYLLDADNKHIILKYRNIVVTFSEEDFNHCVFEPDKEGNKKGKFSKRRAARLLWIKELLEGFLPHKLLFEPDTGNYCLFCEDLEYVVFLWPNKKSKTLRFRSAWAFGKKVEQAMKKYKEGNKFKEVKEIDFENEGC